MLHRVFCGAHQSGKIISKAEAFIIIFFNLWELDVQLQQSGAVPVILEVGPAQCLRKCSDAGYPWQWPTWYAVLRNAIRVAFVVSKEGCTGGSTKTQAPRDFPREKKKSSIF